MLTCAVLVFGSVASLPLAVGGEGSALPRSLNAELRASAPPLRLEELATSEVEDLALYEGLTNRFELKLGGGFYGNFDTALTISSDVLVGAGLDLEDTLGIDENKSVLRLDANYAFNPRHELRLGMFDISRSGTRSVGEDLEIGEVVIPSGSSVGTEFGTTIVKLAYLYNFVAEHRTKIGLSAGLHTMRLDTAFRTSTGSIEETFDATAPLPVFGLHGEYALSRRWSMLASVEFFQLDIGSARGHLTDTLLAFEHDLTDHLGWGVAVNGFNMGAVIEGDGSLEADLVYKYQGLLLYLRAFW